MPLYSHVESLDKIVNCPVTRHSGGKKSGITIINYAVKKFQLVKRLRIATYWKYAHGWWIVVAIQSEEWYECFQELRSFNMPTSPPLVESWCPFHTIIMSLAFGMQRFCIVYLVISLLMQQQQMACVHLVFYPPLSLCHVFAEANHMC